MSMSMYGSPSMLPDVMQDVQAPKANQACMTCRKQKRKCNKALPACALCERMNRPCDYSDATPPPTAEDFNTLRMKLMELESRFAGNNGIANHVSAYPTPLSGPLTGSDGQGSMINPLQEGPNPWQGIQNRFPAIAFLDKDSFVHGGIEVPKPSVTIPVEVLDLLGDGSSVQAILTEYFETVHKWIPIVSQKRLSRNMASPLWEAGPDLALLWLSMKLIISKPQDGVEGSQNPLYMAAKRFTTLLEMTGAATLVVLQANVLIMWFEYGQAIYPAAWMTAGWCVRYGNFLGINGHPLAAKVLRQADTWNETEERRRTWWAILMSDRIVSLGSQSYILNSQEPTENTLLPCNDSAWDNGEMSIAGQRSLSVPITEQVAPFPRLCQASSMMGKVFAHHHGEKYTSEEERFGVASQLYIDASALARQITEESSTSDDYISLTAPLALTFSTLCELCGPYSCPSKNSDSHSAEAARMQAQAIDGLETVARSILAFAERLQEAVELQQDLDRISPLIMDSLYSAAANFAWLVRESGDETSQMALDSLRRLLTRLGTRWRNAAEYARILEAQEFQYAVGSVNA